MAHVQHVSSFEALEQKVQAIVIPKLNSNNGAERAGLRTSLQKLVASLETPEDIVDRAIFFPSTFMCARVAIDLKLFDIIADAGSITAAELAIKSKAEEQLIVRLLRGLTLAGLVGEVGDQVYKANAVTRHLTVPSVQAGLIHFYDAGLKSLYFMPEFFKTNGYKYPEDPTSGPLQYAFNTPLESYSFWQTQPHFRRNFNAFMAGKWTSTKTGQTRDQHYDVKEQIIDRFDPAKCDAMFVDIADLEPDFPMLRDPGRFILEDLPAVMDDIQELDSRIERIPYDFFTSQPVKYANVYFLLE